MVSLCNYCRSSCRLRTGGGGWTRGGGLDKVTQNIRLLSQHLFCYWVLHRNSESSSIDLKAV